MILWEENSHTFCKAERFLVLFENVIKMAMLLGNVLIRWKKQKKQMKASCIL